MLERTHAGRAFRILNVIGEYNQECLAILVERNHDHEDVQECLAELFCTCEVPPPISIQIVP
jgi:putative transposase